MSLERYRLRVPLLAVDTAASKRIVRIPKGATLTVIGYPNGDRFVTVAWEGQQLLVFAQDLKERAAPLDPAS